MKKLKQRVSDPIPSDLLIDIFLRVPTKSIARFRCVSKSWGSTIRLPDFTELFLTKSLTRPRILFHFKFNKQLFLFSSPQPDQNNDLNGEECDLVATRYSYSPKLLPSRISPTLRGLVVLHGVHERGRKGRERVICNPLTGESITLPQLKATGSFFLGYDPINKQIKVLCMSYEGPNTHQVLTLGTGKRFWRSTVECKPHYSLDDNGVCISGVLYYRARFEEGSPSYMMVCFDFSSEKFSFIKTHEEIFRGRGINLMNYKGKLCALYFTDVDGHDEFDDQLVVVLWVLEDAGEHKWSKTICVLPLFRDASIQESHCVVGMTGTGDLVFKPFGHSSNPFCLVFYNMERNSFTRVNIHGFQEFKHHSFKISTFLDYVESMTTLNVSAFD